MEAALTRLRTEAVQRFVLVRCKPMKMETMKVVRQDVAQADPRHARAAVPVPKIKQT